VYKKSAWLLIAMVPFACPWALEVTTKAVDDTNCVKNARYEALEKKVKEEIERLKTLVTTVEQCSADKKFWNGSACVAPPCP
jgi:hypothetical protein